MSDFIASVMGSLAQVLVGHPFDTAKVLIQNKQSLFNLKPLQYYRGCRYPFVSSILTNACLFPIYERTKSITNSAFISGFIGGCVISPIVFVSDYYKIFRQMNDDKKGKPTRSLLRSYGKFSVFCRESVAYTTFFGVYDLLKNDYDFHPMISGSICGVCNWTITYPIDTIRNRQIAQQINILDAIKQKKFFKGYSVCFLRAIFVNAALFYTYDTVYNYLRQI